MNAKAWPAGADTQTAELPCGWHRVTWKRHGKTRYVITDHIGAAVDVHSAMSAEARETDWVSDVHIEHWEPKSLH